MNRKIGNLFKGDKVIWMVFFFLCMISVVEVFSASSGLTYKSSNYISPILKHVGTIITGLVFAVLTLNVPCRYFKIATPFLIGISVLTLVWVLVGGENINGAQRVIALFGLTFQPSEIAKGTVILAEAQILSAMQGENGADKKAFRFILCITIPMAFLIMLENLSTALLLCIVVVMTMFVGRVPMTQIGKLMGIVMLAGALCLGGIMLFGHDENENEESKDRLSKTEKVARPKKVDEKSEKNDGVVDKVFHRASVWKTRIKKFLDDKPVPPDKYDLDKDAQVAHANIAIVSSNVIGKGPGNSVERDFLAQAFSDFIYAIIIEEMGIIGAAVVVFLYVVLLFRAARIAGRCENNFPAFLAMGLALMLVVQATFNMLVAVGLAPVTGQPLPLISKGGTSTIINCIYVGAILSVSRSAKKKPSSDDTQSHAPQTTKSAA